MASSLAPAETFTPDEQKALAPYFTNLDSPVFALINLPEVVKGAQGHKRLQVRGRTAIGSDRAIATRE